MIEVACELAELSPRIVVMGVGGAGGNAVASMMSNDVRGVEFVVANTDAQALRASPAPRQIQLGVTITQGLGAGSRAEVGRAAAEESLSEIEAALEGAHMCFIAAGMGGGTGTGAAPVIARIAQEKGILTLGVVSKPFAFEGRYRAQATERGLTELAKHVDTLIVIPNQNLFRVATPNTTFKAAFDLADEILHEGVRGITDLIVTPGLINLDFADVRTIMANRGRAMMGSGEAAGEERARRATQQAIANPLLDDALQGARGLIISVSGGDDMKLTEVDEVASYVREMVDPEADIIWGSSFDPALAGRIRVSIFATGIELAQAEAEAVQPAPIAARMVRAPTVAPVAPDVAARHPAAAPVFIPVQLDMPLDWKAGKAALDEPDEEELLLTFERTLILSPPDGIGEIPTIDPFGEDQAAPVVPFPGPSLFERIATAARNRTWDQPAPGPRQWKSDGRSLSRAA
jgi:cell division protein FtsZ